MVAIRGNRSRRISTELQSENTSAAGKWCVYYTSKEIGYLKSQINVKDECQESKRSRTIRLQLSSDFTTANNPKHL